MAGEGRFRRSVINIMVYDIFMWRMDTVAEKNLLLSNETEIKITFVVVKLNKFWWNYCIDKY